MILSMLRGRSTGVQPCDLLTVSLLGIPQSCRGIARQPRCQATRSQASLGQLHGCGAGASYHPWQTAASWTSTVADERHVVSLRQENDRRELLQLSEAQLGDVVRFCNRYPDIQMAHQVLDADNVRAGEQARGCDRLKVSPQTTRL